MLKARSILTILTAVVLGIPLVPQPAAAAPCSLDGSGTAGDPFRVGTAADLTCLSNVSAYWAGGVTLRQTADIDMSGRVWTEGIAAGGGFNAVYDGGGHLISNLTVAASGAAANAALFSRVASLGRIRDLGLTDVSVTAHGTTPDVPGHTDTYAGALVGYLNSNAVIERVFSTGVVVATSDNELGIVRAGGLVGFSSAGTIIDSYSTAAVSAHTAAASPSSLESSHAGGIVALAMSSSPSYPDVVVRSYASGPVSATSAGADATGSGIGEVRSLALQPPARVSGLLWDVETTGQAGCTLESGVTGTCTGASTAAMTSLATFADAGWSVSAGLIGSTTWGICPAVNGGYPFLRVFEPSGPCEASGQYPPPWYQSYARASASEACTSGWYPSWDRWPGNGAGGWVCNRRLAYNGSTWVAGPSL